MLTKNPLEMILDKVIAIVGAESGSILLRNADTAEFESRVTIGPLTPITEMLARRVAETGAPQLVGSVDADPHLKAFAGDTDAIISLASFPLAIENATIGVLTLNNSHRNAFGEETKRIMHIIAGQIAIAVENARLYGEVKKTKEYLENLVDRAGDAIFTLDQAHNIVNWNNGAEEIFKRNRQDVCGSTIYDMVPEDLTPALKEKIASILEAENIITVETQVNRGDGQITQIALTLSPIRGAEGEVVGVSGIAKDIAERKKVEEGLLRLNEAKSNFVSTVSHELRTPLTSIKSLAEVLLLQTGSLTEDDITRSLSTINKECDQLSELISNVLELQKFEAGKLEVPFDRVVFADVVRHVATLFEAVAIQRRIDLRSECTADDDMTVVMGNRQWLMRILSNLASNAVKYTNPGGAVRISLGREGDSVRLTVSDNGIGIPKEDREKVFERFYRVSNAATRCQGGTGLGLAITRELVEQHNGKIWVESRDEGGSSFNVLIPAAN
jgi:PAS domain S-box-containing protein